MDSMKIKRFTAVILGNLFLGIGVALLSISQMGNDPYSACNMAVSDVLGIGLGVYQMILNFVIFIVQILCGKKYIGFGTIVNLFLLGYIVEFSQIVWKYLIGTGEGYPFWLQLIVMVIALVIVSYGLSLYQVADMGVAPYDYLALGLNDNTKLPYFISRIITDASCVIIVIIIVIAGLLGWGNCHLGLGTIICVFCLGPFIAAFSKFNRKLIGFEVQDISAENK